MSLIAHMKRSAGEYALVAVSVCALAVTALDGFFLFSISDALGTWGRAAVCSAACLVLLAVLFASTARRDRTVVWALVFAALAGLFVATCLAFSDGPARALAEDPDATVTLADDAEGNYLYFAVICVICTLAGFLLSRTLAGCVVWLVTGALACSVVEAFYETGELALAITFTLSALALIVHKNFRLGIEGAEVANSPSRLGAFATAIGSCALITAAAAALWFGVIAPLNPPVADVKLITEYESLPIVEQKGTAQEEPALDLSMTSDDVVAGEAYTTDDLVKDPTSSVEVNSAAITEQQMQNSLESDADATGGTSGGGTTSVLDEESEEEEYEGQSYSRHFPWIVVRIVLAVLAVLAVIAYFVGRRVLRRRHLRQMLESGPPADQLKAVYRFLLTRLGRLGFECPAGMTLLEWSRASRRQTDVIDEVCGVPFASLTASYVACDYGCREPTEEEVVAASAYYLRFWRAARAELGTFKYFFRSFRL